MRKKVYEVDPLICPSCGGQMRVIAFIEDHKVINKIIRHLKLIFTAERVRLGRTSSPSDCPAGTSDGSRG